MRSSVRGLNPSEAAARLGVSAKALRLYEQRGLVAPSRTSAGWRVYGPDDMSRAAAVVAFRALGLTLAQVARVQAGNAQDMTAALAAHQTFLETQIGQLAGVVDRLRALRTDLAQGQVIAPDALTRLVALKTAPAFVFDLPWPWGGERFELRDVRALNYIIGPLGSGKTRLARCLAATIPNAAFLGLDRAADHGASAQAQMDADPALKSRVEERLKRLVGNGAVASAALMSLLVGLEADGPTVRIVDMVEQGLDQSTQEALIAQLRDRGSVDRPLFLTTRSEVILTLADVGTDEAILLCPANHSMPTRVAPHPGAPGYEAVSTCLASPAVRARTEGVIA